MFGDVYLLRTQLYILIILSVTTLGLGQGVQSQSSIDLLTGPELVLDYQPQAAQSNPVDCFMYFIPLTSPTSVTVSTAPGTTFSANITSWKRKQNGKTVHVQCDFEVTGEGGYSATYDPEEMIQKQCDNHQKKSKAKEITILLDWIRLDGPCLGRIEGYGTVVDGQIQMNSIEVSFNRDKTKSPVEVSIYDVPRKKGQFLYANRENCQIARVNALTFKRDHDGSPRMSVEIASIKKAKKKEGFFSHLTAMIANIFSTSMKVPPVGNSTMMDFGTALYEKEPAFTFPKAANIKQLQSSATYNSQASEFNL